MAARSKGTPNRARNGLCRPAWARFVPVRPWPLSQLLLTRFAICVHLHVGLWHHFLRLRVLQTPPSSDIKIAHLKFLFVLRLSTGIDLRDQADLASAMLVTIGSWFSDCVGASSLSHRSRIARVNNHQIEVISTHWQIRHSPSIKWYQLSRLIGEFIECFYFL
jgi:hypothetical protein